MALAVTEVRPLERYKVDLDMSDDFLKKNGTVDKENPESRSEKIQEMLALLNEEPDIVTRTDDTNLLRFLRAKFFNTEQAFQLLKSYEGLKTKSWLDMDMDLIKKITLNGAVQVLPCRDQLGRRIFYLQGGKWKPSDCVADCILQAGALIADTTIIEPMTQVAGIVMVMNLKDIGMTQAKGLSTAFAKKMVNLLAYCLPVRINAIHIVNEPAIFSMIYAIFKAFLTDRMKKKIFFHGSNYASLQKHVCPEALPQELGGTCDDVDPKLWYETLTSELVMKELRSLGYKFKNL